MVNSGQLQLCSKNLNPKHKKKTRRMKEKEGDEQKGGRREKREGRKQGGGK